MNTVTKTYTENAGSGAKATWTVSVTGSDVVANSDTVTIPCPTGTAKYVQATKKYAWVEVPGWFELYPDNGESMRYGSGYMDLYRGHNTYSLPATTSRTTYSLSREVITTAEYDTSRIFNAGNASTRTVEISYVVNQLSLGTSILKDSHESGSGRSYISYDAGDRIIWRNISSVTLNAPPTFSAPTVSKDTSAGWYSSVTTMSVSVPISYSSSGTSATAKYGGYVSKIAVTVGAQIVTKTYTASTRPTSAQTLSLLLNNAGTFTPTVSVTDSRGQTTTVSLSEITVLPYNAPSVNFDVYRTDDSGVKADEGTYGLIEGTIDYTSAVTNLVAPSVKINNGTPTSNVSWYSDRALTTAINWANVASGATVYGLINGSFTESSYEITLTAEDDLGSFSTPITQTLSTAFYTIDVRAGGKEIAFGRPANDDLTDIHGKDVSDYGFFKCGMEAEFENDAVVDGDISVDNITATGDISADNVAASGNVSASGSVTANGVTSTGGISAIGSASIGGNLTLSGHSSEVGDRITVQGSSTTSNVSQSADAYVTIGSIPLPAGFWIVVLRARFVPSASGNNYPAIYFTSSSTGSGWHQRAFTQGTTNAQLAMTCFANPSDTTQDTPYYLRGYSNTAGTWSKQNNAQFVIDAVRLV